VIYIGCVKSSASTYLSWFGHGMVGAYYQEVVCWASIWFDHLPWKQ